MVGVVLAASRAALIIFAAAFVVFFLFPDALEVEGFGAVALDVAIAVVADAVVMGMVLLFCMLSISRGRTPPCGMVTFLKS